MGTNILQDVQAYVVGKLSADYQLSGMCTFLVENSKDIDYQIKNALARQGIVAVCMTPKATYAGKYEDAFLAWTLESLEVDIVENTIVNRGKKNGYMTGQDIAMRLFDVLCPLSGDFEGQFCPVHVEEGEDNGLLVNRCVLKALVWGEHSDVPQPPKPLTYQFVKLLDEPPPLSVQPLDGWMWNDNGTVYFYSQHVAHKLGGVSWDDMSSYVSSQVSSKADLSDVFGLSVAISSCYTKNETSSSSQLEAAFAGKASIQSMQALSTSMSSYYTKSQTSSAYELKNAFASKADLSSLDSYYTKSQTSSSTQISEAIASKAEVSALRDYYTKSHTSSSYELDVAFANKANMSSLQSYLPLSGGVISGILGVTGYSQFHDAVDMPQANFTISSDEDAYNSIRSSSASSLEIRGNYGSTAAALPIKNGTIAYVSDIEQQVSSKADLSSVPSKVSDLANDVGYITSAAISSKAEASALQSYLPLSGGIISGVLEVSQYSQFHGAIDTPQVNIVVSSDEDTYNSIRSSSATELEIRGNYGSTAATLPIKNGTIAYVSDIEQQVSSKAETSALDEVSSYVQNKVNELSSSPYSCGWRIDLKGTQQDSSLSAVLYGTLTACTKNRTMLKFSCVLDSSNIPAYANYAGMSYDVFSRGQLSDVYDGHEMANPYIDMYFSDAWGYHNNVVPSVTQTTFLSIALSISR